MVQSLSRCGSCGLPGKLAENLTWGCDGTIRLSGLKWVKLAFMDADCIRDIYDGLAVMLGSGSLDDGERDVTHLITGRLISGFKRKLSRYDILKRRILEAMEDYSLILGMGRIELERYTPVAEGSMLLKWPIHLNMVEAGIAGILECMDRCTYSYHTSVLSGGCYRLRFDLKRKGTRHGGSLGKRETVVVNEDGEELKRCEKCGLPCGMSVYRWDELHGVIEEGTEGRRMVFIPVDAINIMVRMGNDVGEDTGNGIVGEAIRSCTLRQLETGKESTAEGGGSGAVGADRKGIAEYMSRPSLWGWGHVEDAGISGEVWRICMTSPLPSPVITGWLSGLYTSAIGRRPLIDVVEDAPRTIMELG
ncbi:MAG: hypothetical protein SWK76_07105 [Actinomycetota bacterium]|nr:hypothetical protein [Actinomycetota bacterium]